MERYRVYFAGFLAVIVLTLSGVALAHISNQSPTIVSKPVVHNLETSQKKAPEQQNPAQPQTSTQTNDSCKTTTTSDVDETPPDTHNNSTTITDCDNSSSNGGVNITNNSTQSATSGDSTGTSGNVSNSNNTDINITE